MTNCTLNTTTHWNEFGGVHSETQFNTPAEARAAFHAAVQAALEFQTSDHQSEHNNTAKIWLTTECCTHCLTLTNGVVTRHSVSC